MELSLLYEKLNKFSEKRTDDFSKEFTNDVFSWVKSMDQYISEVELDLVECNIEIKDKDDLIELMVKIFISIGRSDILTMIQIMDKDQINSSVSNILETRQRNVNIHVNSFVDA